MLNVVSVLVDRANYGRMKPILLELKKNDNVNLDIICAGSMVLRRFQQTSEVAQADNFKITDELYFEVEGSIPLTMAKSLGLAVIEFSNSLNKLKPDVVLIIGDRFEALAAALAAAFQNFCVVHIQGGEISGSIDESTRHAITKFSHYHFPSTDAARKNIINMGEAPSTVFNFGCPVGDLILSLKKQNYQSCLPTIFSKNFNFADSYLLVIHHPTTTDIKAAELEMEEILKALKRLKLPAIMLWPNIDAGSDSTSKIIRRFLSTELTDWLTVVKNFVPEDFQYLLGNAACALGNSSSFVRDSSFWGTPVVLIGNRQKGRETAGNVINCKTHVTEIVRCVDAQIKHGPYKSSNLYGKGDAAVKIAKKITELDVYSQKQLCFPSMHVPEENFG